MKNTIHLQTNTQHLKLFPMFLFTLFFFLQRFIEKTYLYFYANVSAELVLFVVVQENPMVWNGNLL